jgi:ABC-type transporter Mla maintaining outer membrane lipid asymmetry ATPase subunit MlaF
VRGLVNRFGDHTIHEYLDLDVRRGEILGVVGGSGTGKSVLMRSIIGLQIPRKARSRCSAARSPMRATMPISTSAASGACCSRAARCSRR